MLPAYNPGGAVDFSGLNRGLDQGFNALAEGRKRQQNLKVTNALSRGEDDEAQAATDDPALALSIGTAQRSKEQADDAKFERFKAQSVGIAQAILADKDPARAQAQWQRLVSSDPRYQKTLTQYGVDPNDYKTGAGLMVAEQRGYRDPVDEQIKRSQLATADLTRQGLGLDLQIKQRDLNSPADKFTIAPEGSTILRNNPRTGASEVVYQAKPKQDSITKKEIIEADQGVQAGNSALSQLSRALELSADAYSGFGADTRAGIVDAVVPWATPQASATVQMKQVVASQALESLKATFGGAPTEGERKILIEIQGSANQSKATREDIFRRAQQLIKSRIDYNKAAATGLRSGNYFQPEGAPQAFPSSPGAQPQQGAQSAPVQLNGKTYVKINGQWVEQ
jgi:hypothetical protein